MIQAMDEYFPVQYMVLLLFVYIFLWSKYGKCLQKKLVFVKVSEPIVVFVGFSLAEH